MSETIYITPRSVTREGHPTLQRLEDAGFGLLFCEPGQQPDEGRLLKDLPGCVGMLAGVEPISDKVLQAAAPSLKVIARNGVGVNNIDLDAAERLGIAVLPAVGANARGVAELTVGLMFALARSLPSCDAAMKQQQWARSRGIELIGRTLGVIGCGRVGREVAHMALAIGMRVIAYDPYPDQSFAPGDGFTWAELDEAIASSDVISLHCPVPDDGQPLITPQRLALMKLGTRLINTARAELLNETAVLQALDQGHLLGLAIDAFRREPPGDDPLVMHERVIATPHIGGFTDESVNRAMAAAVQHLLNHLSAGVAS